MGLLIMIEYIKEFFISLVKLVVLVTVVGGFFFYKSLEIERDPDEYTARLSKWNRSSLVSHFPKKLDDNMEVLGFSAQSGLLQGGSHIQLRLRRNKKQIQRLHKIFSDKATKIFIGGNSIQHLNQENGMPTTSFFTANEKDEQAGRPFPKDYEIMIFDNVIPREDSAGGYWNHATTHGVAISKKRNEIVYWAESW